MTFTTKQRDDLKKAIAEGVLEYMYEGKRVKYRSLDEQLRILSLMNAELDASTASGNQNVTLATFDRDQ